MSFSRNREELGLRQAQGTVALFGMVVCACGLSYGVEGRIWGGKICLFFLFYF